MDDSKIRWSVSDIFGRKISLKEETLEYHVNRDHDTKDADGRLSIEAQVKETLEEPEIVSKDPDHDNRLWYLGFSIINDQSASDYLRFKNIKVVIERIDELSYDVVTWIGQRTMKVKKGEVLYVRKKIR